MALITARKRGNTIYLCIPAHICSRGSIRQGDIFKLERDVLLPDIYTLRKVSNNDEL